MIARTPGGDDEEMRHGCGDPNRELLDLLAPNGDPAVTGSAVETTIAGVGVISCTYKVQHFFRIGVPQKTALLDATPRSRCHSCSRRWIVNGFLKDPPQILFVTRTKKVGRRAGG
jgi:hypothetical protein